MSVFTSGGAGGNPATLILEASGMEAEEMRGVARECGHECAFVLPATGPAADVRLRFFVPNQEMDMCGHGTAGALWLLARRGALGPGEVQVETASGVVTGRIGAGGEVEVGQPRGESAPVAERALGLVLAVLGVETGDLLARPLTAWTSRPKTLVPLASVQRLNELRPDFARMKALCEGLGATGLYPFAPVPGRERVYEARQFPADSGYPEDPATGVAATALAAGLPAAGLAHAPEAITVIQGRAMGHPSEIRVRRAELAEGAGWWLGGEVRFLEDPATAAR